MNAWVASHPSGGTYIPSAVAGELFYGDCTRVATERAVSLLVPQAAGHGRGQVDIAAWKHVTSRYILCRDDRAMSPEVQRRMAERCASTFEIDASHSPYVSRPSVIASLILDEGR